MAGSCIAIRAHAGNGENGARCSNDVVRNGRWRATIAVNKVQRHLGRFNTIEEAAAAYDQAIRELHGEFAFTTEEMKK